jgi:hypothetical protein
LRDLLNFMGCAPLVNRGLALAFIPRGIYSKCLQFAIQMGTLKAGVL